MVTLVSTLHDPEGRMVEATRRHLDGIFRLYEALVVVPTEGTSGRLLEALRGARVEPLAESRGAIGVGRRHALRLGLEAGSGPLHYCDFDRVLHWTGSYPAELDRVLGALEGHDYLILGRTERAFATHPRVQRDTESITNQAFSRWFGRPVDVAAGSCGVSRRAADLLLRLSTAPTNATDAEWPALACLLPEARIGFLPTEGLEFETPDYFPQEIAAAGSLERWLEQRYGSLGSWVARTRLAMESLEALARVVDSGAAVPRQI